VSPPGWYPDPAGNPSAERYWDGTAWTGSLRLVGTPGAGGDAGATATPGSAAYQGTYQGAGPAAPPGGYPFAFPGPTPYPFPSPSRTNTFAIVSLVCSLASFLVGVSCIAGIVFGHLALRQIRRTGEEGRGMAIAGLVIGYVALVILVLVVVLVAVVVISGPHTIVVPNNGVGALAGHVPPP